jgi:hypothetical protein
MRLSIHRVLLPTLIAILLSAIPAAAQQEDTVPRAEPRGGVAMIGGLRLGWPQKLSAYVGIGIPEKRFEHGYTGWSVTVEPGLGGGLVGIGHTTTGGIGMTWRGQFAVMRTWGDPWMVGPDQTYAGGDVRMMIAWFGFSVGGFVRIPDADNEVGALLTASLVIGN